MLIENAANGLQTTSTETVFLFHPYALATHLGNGAVPESANVVPVVVDAGRNRTNADVQSRLLESDRSQLKGNVQSHPLGSAKNLWNASDESLRTDVDESRPIADAMHHRSADAVSVGDGDKAAHVVTAGHDGATAPRSVIRAIEVR